MSNVNAEIKWQGNDNAWFTTNAAVIFDANIQIFHIDGRYKFTDGITALSALPFLGAGIDNIFTVQFETGTLSPSDATTYYFSDLRLTPNLTATNFNYNLGFAYTIIGARISIGNNIVSGTTELATLKIRNITQSTTSSLGTFRTDATSVSIKGTTFTGASISVAASDNIVAQIDFPTYANNPTNILIFLTLICKK
jgi:hypothetical protein